MKKAFFSVFFSLAFVTLFASDGFRVTYTQPQGGTHQLVYTIDNYSVSGVTLQGVEYSRINFEGKVVTQKKGFAELPYLNATVMIDPVKNFTVEIIPGSYEDIDLAYPLVPSRGVIYRNQDPSAVPYTIDPRSVTDAWYPVNLAESTEPFILRDIRGTSVYVYPFQYNAERGILRVYKSITVKLVENNTVSLNPLPKVPTSIVREMDGIYRSVFINYASSNRDNLTIGEFGDIHVIVTSRDETAIQPYVQWKKEKGYNVSVEVVPSGTVVNANVQAAYDNNNNILYVLLVGDWADLQCTMSGSGRPMDPQVGTVVGNDDYADIAVGRFSANSPADVTVQVNKVINYEKLPDMAGTWYSSATGMASAEGAGIGDDGEADAAHETVIYNDKLDPFTYTTNTTIYDPGATVAMVNNAVNTGTSVINYTGHGWSGGWGTTGFNSDNVAALTNGNKLPFIISVACNNGDFDLGTCFGESWLRKENGGAIMFLGASISQPWQEPMRGQDYFMDVLIGGYDYTVHPGQNGISTTEQRTTLGATVFNGLTLMCVESGGSSDWETAKTWNFFGDPSLQARTATPAVLTLTNYNIMVGIPFTTTVTSSGGPVENAMVTLSQGDLFFTGITDAAGSVTIDHTLNPGTAKLVVTGFNTETIYQDQNVIPPNGAYISISSVNINDAAGNGNGLLDYGETAFLTIALSNVGSADASNVTAQISSGDEFIGISNASAVYGNIPAGETVTITDGFEINALENIPDLHISMFQLDASGTSGRETWSSSFVIPGHAPVLEMTEYLIDDSGGNNNGRLDPGETATIQIFAQNTGSSDAFNVMGNLSTESQYITITGSPLAYGNIATGTNASQAFEVTIDETTPAGHAPVFLFDLAADMNITGHSEFVEYIGQIPVLLLDWDPNHNSPGVIEQCLTNLQVGHEMMETMPADRNLYTSIFVCLGTYSENHVMTAEEGQILADYLNQGGNLYLEGADTWYYDQTTTPTPVHPMFNISGLEDGAGDLSQLNGQAGTIAEGMSFQYSGDNAYVDHLSAIPPAQVMFLNNSPEYGACVSYDEGSYRTIGSSFEFGGLQDGDKTKDDMMIKMLEFFKIQGVWTGLKDNQPGASLNAGSYPNPFREETVIRFDAKNAGRVSLEVYNINGQLVNRLLDAEVNTGIREVTWDGSNSAGDRVAEGMYFYRLQAGNELVTGKLMLMK
jgi:hypothetical protein